MFWKCFRLDRRSSGTETCPGAASWRRQRSRALSFDLALIFSSGATRNPNLRPRRFFLLLNSLVSPHARAGMRRNGLS